VGREGEANILHSFHNTSTLASALKYAYEKKAYSLAYIHFLRRKVFFHPFLICVVYF